MSSVTIGKDTLGAGGKRKVDFKTYERSTHDLGYKWRSTMSAGTLVPFMSQVALTGDTFDIDLDIDVKTHPTIGPLFGSYKVQVDVFQCPVRLYQGLLHMNLLDVGMKMETVKLPIMEVKADGNKIENNEQINPSCILNYLGIKGVGKNLNTTNIIKRDFNGVPMLAYWDIYKNYYANKQENQGAFIHNAMMNGEQSVKLAKFGLNTILTDDLTNAGVTINLNTTTLYFDMKETFEPDLSQFKLLFDGESEPLPIQSVFFNVTWTQVPAGAGVPMGGQIACSNPRAPFQGTYKVICYVYNGAVLDSRKPKVKMFPLDNLDDIKKEILRHPDDTLPYVLNESTKSPIGDILGMGDFGFCKESTQEGLGLKTYQSDIFNNWVQMAYIDGTGGVTELSKVDTSQGHFSIDTLIVARKVYDMLNRIAMSGGSYDDWNEAVYDYKNARKHENPIYCGGLSKELAFQEVISNTASNIGGIEQPIGTLAGKGVMTGKHKGGKVTIKVDEISYIIGIVSLTPRIDYSQGNDWDVNLKTMDDFHKPGLDQIGFQDLITDQMAWWDTFIDNNNIPVFKKVGQIPAWTNYMTNYNRTYGNFADREQQMFMTLNRDYEQDGFGDIKDLTTYIDPSKHNHIFADTRIDAQNFWVQMRVDIMARRKMSAKVMPNL